MTRGDSATGVELIPWCEEDSRHGISGEPSGGLFGGRVAAAGGGDQEREPEPPSPVPGGGPGRDEPDGGSPDRRDGSPDAARLGAPVQRARSGRPFRQLVQGS